MVVRLTDFHPSLIVEDKLTVIVLCNNEFGPAAALAKVIADVHVPNLDQTSIAALNQRAHFAQQQKQFAEAARLYVVAIEKGARDSENAYHAARCLSLIDERDKAFSYLESAIELGFKNAELLKADQNLQLLRSDPRWPKIVKRLQAKVNP